MLGTDHAAVKLASAGAGQAIDARPEVVAGRLSVIVRAHKSCDRALLDKALQSLAGQKYEPVEVMVVTDALLPEQQRQLSAVINAQRWPAQIFARLEPVDCSDLSDSRSRLLNAGIGLSTGQYIAFLDYDDVVYENGYCLLIEELIASGKGVAAGGTRVAEVSWQDGVLEIANVRDFAHDGRSKVDLWKGNFLPIHSFVINRFLVPAEAIGTDENLKRLEDHCLLLRLSFVTEFSLSKLSEAVCEYRVFNGVFSGDRTKFLEAKDSDIASWRQSKEYLHELIARSQALVSVPQLKADIQDRIALERTRMEQQVRAELQFEIEALKQRANDAEQSNLALSYQVEKWQAANKSLGAMLDQQNAELSRRPYKIVRAVLSFLNKIGRKD